MSARLTILTFIYVLILAGIVILADLQGTNYFSFIGYIPFGDKIGHFCLMGMFSFLLNLVLKVKQIRFLKVNLLLGSLIVFLIVTLEELSQIFVRGRSFDVTDLIADYTGIFLFGQIAVFIFRRLFKK